MPLNKQIVFINAIKNIDTLEDVHYSEVMLSHYTEESKLDESTDSQDDEVCEENPVFHKMNLNLTKSISSI